MKKLYKVLVGRCDANEGKTTWNDEEYVMTENVEKYVEEKTAEIEAGKYWWMDHRTDYKTNRPMVWAEELEVREV